MPGYNTNELYQIWKKQLKPLTVKQENDKKFLKLFNKNKDIFPNFAGDTERLVNYVRLRRTDRFMSSKISDDGSIVYEDLEKGIETLKRNTVKETPKSEEQKIRDIMSKYM